VKRIGLATRAVSYAFSFPLGTLFISLRMLWRWYTNARVWIAESLTSQVPHKPRPINLIAPEIR
jgi:hypothetical protein